MGELVQFRYGGKIIAKRERDQYVLAPVLIADVLDRQKDIYNGREVEKAAWSFSKNGWTPDYMHERIIGPREAMVVESWVYRPDIMGSPLVIKNGDTLHEYTTHTWFMGFLLGDDIWQDYLDGKLTGLSITGTADRDAEEYEIELEEAA